MTTSIRLPAEWEEQDGVLLSWPNEATVWRPVLSAAEQTLAQIIARISRFERVIVIAMEPGRTAGRLRDAGASTDRVTIHRVPSNDVWARDFGPITVLENGRPVLLDFTFNGWGGRHAADLDNQVTHQLQAQDTFGTTPLRSVNLILEGGSVDSDGRGTILTTRSCLANPNRNPRLDQRGLDAELTRLLGAQRVLWLEHGYLAGDDTDGHVDMLARFAPDDTILHVSCADAQDEHFNALSEMSAELRQLRTRGGQPYRLIPLPWPAPKFDPQGQRLPASYANFLVINDALLVPTYGDQADAAAQAAVGQAFPGREIIGVDCSTLILQHGSLHCVTMQIPKGVLT